MISLGSDGRVLSQGSLTKVLATDDKLSKELAKGAQAVDKVEQQVDVEAPDADAPTKKGSEGKLVAAEEISVGAVGWPSCEL